MKKLILLLNALFISNSFADIILEKAIEQNLKDNDQFLRNREKRVKIVSVKATERVFPANPLKELFSYLPNIGLDDKTKALDFISFDLEVTTEQGIIELTCNSSHFYNCGYFSLNTCGSDKGIFMHKGSVNIVYDEEKQVDCRKKTADIQSDSRNHDESAEEAVGEIQNSSQLQKSKPGKIGTEK